jgi:predicted RecB family nuclease
MHFHDSRLQLSPSDLSGFLGCRHRTGLDLAVAHRALMKPVWNDPMVQALRERGAEHEQAYVTSLRDQRLDVVEIDADQNLVARAAATLEAMTAGRDVIVQAALVQDGWTGYADILRRVDTPSALGNWSYEPYDTKLARETRGSTILQLAVYVELLAQMQGSRPERFHVVTPVAVHTYRFADFAAYFRVVRSQMRDTLAFGHEAIRAGQYPEPVEQCEVCRWWDRCNTQRRKDDHLSFIAGASRLHRQELVVQGYPTLATAAAMPVPIAFKPARGSRDTYARIREQARLQHQQRTEKRPIHELLPLVEKQGLSRLPIPSPGDLFLDLEAARFAREGGREYLFGVWTREQAESPGLRYDGRWAFTDAEERSAFEALIDRIMAVLAADSGMHVYHFGHYEPSALKRLMGRHATRADQLDQLLRGERFVDLHAVVRQALRAGVESYSIKQLEQFYGFARDVPLHSATAHLQVIELALESDAAASIAEGVRAAVQGYNRDDCRSTEELRDWLEGLRADLMARGTDVPRPTLKDGDASQKVSELEKRQEAARAQLLAGLPPEVSARDHPQHPVWLLAYLLDWHRREDKSAWWEFFRLSDLSEEDLVDESAAIARLEHVQRVVVEQYKNGNIKSAVDRYRYPLQETEIRCGSKLRMPGGDRVGVVSAHDRVARTIEIAKGRASADVHPTAVFEAEVIGTGVQQEALLRFADTSDVKACGNDLLFRRPPRLLSGDFHPRGEETTAEFAVRLSTDLDRTTLAVQGPPGSGKTYVGAQMIRALVRAGKKVGVTAVSHKVIRNLLDAVRAQATDRIDLGHKCAPDEDDDEGTHMPVAEFGDNDAALGALASGEIQVLGGTSWLWSREDAANTVDVLFVDEAGQMSLANALAVSGAALSLVLLGDPQQLEQPQKGSHPDGVGVSALEHVLGGAATMPADRGLFLPTTWRLHPAICAFTSELFYEGKLESKAGLERQRLTRTGAFDGAGLWWVPVAHDGNQNYSVEEVDAVAHLVDTLLAPGAMWIDEHDIARQLTGSDLRIVAPFNAQVNRLLERLAGRGVQVGTVDKFQGQEAPVVIYSMATSRSEDAPRGMEFLYSLNRLNVATSRARCAAIVVASPRLCEPACRTPRQMVLANALCRYREMAQLRNLWS